MIVMPTGAGKSLVIAATVDRLAGKQILVITPRRRLLMQTRTLLCEHGVLSSSLGNDLGDRHRVVAGTYQTMTRRPQLAEPDVIIIDECHLVPPEGDYAELVRRFPKAAVIGLTATPFRGRKHIKHCGIEWEQLFAVNMLDLIDQGVIVRPISMATSSSLSIQGDGPASLIEVTERIVPSLHSAMEKEGRKRCVVFCINIAHAKLTARLLRAAGENSVHIVHSQQSAEQDAEFKAFQTAAGRSWLVNVNLVSVGVDIPCVDSIAILRNVSSLALLIQMIGRGLRIWGEKQDCLVWDFGDGTRRFGFIDDPELDMSEVGDAPPPMRACPLCNALMHASARSCPRCGHVFPRAVSLHEAALGAPLLSADYLVATYEGASKSRDARGIWIVQHRLVDQGRPLVSTTVARSEEEALKLVWPAGASVLVRRLRERQVKIVSPHRSTT